MLQKIKRHYFKGYEEAEVKLQVFLSSALAQTCGRAVLRPTRSKPGERAPGRLWVGGLVNFSACPHRSQYLRYTYGIID